MKNTVLSVFFAIALPLAFQHYWATSPVHSPTAHAAGEAEYQEWLEYQAEKAEREAQEEALKRAEDQAALRFESKGL